MRAPVVFVALFVSGCFYDFPLEEKHQCQNDGVCAAGSSCIGGECVDNSRATCTVQDRRCIGTVAWTCVDGKHEEGTDCKATGEVCVSGACAPACGAGNGCPDGYGCDPSAGACVKFQACARDADCGAGYTCFVPPEAPKFAVCAAIPAEAAKGDVSCYATAQPSGVVASVDAILKNVSLSNDVKGASLTFVNGQQSVTTDTAGKFKLANVNKLELLQFSVDAASNTELGLAQQAMFGPILYGFTTPKERVDLAAFTADDLTQLLKTEAGDLDPRYEPRGHAVVLARVRSCSGLLLQNATVSLSFAPGRTGYFAEQLRRQGSAKATPANGGWLAFDVPVDVELYAVATALDASRQVVQIPLGVIKVPAPTDPAVPYTAATLAIGRAGVLP